MSLVSTNTLIRKAAQLTLSDYGYNMIAVGSNDWDDILGTNVQSGNLLNYYLEIDGVDYQVSEIKLGSKTADFGGISLQRQNIPLDIVQGTFS